VRSKDRVVCARIASRDAADRIAACDIDKKPRAKDRASDHTQSCC
jgi:hypothetical protein